MLSNAWPGFCSTNRMAAVRRMIFSRGTNTPRDPPGVPAPTTPRPLRPNRGGRKTPPAWPGQAIVYAASVLSMLLAASPSRALGSCDGEWLPAGDGPDGMTAAFIFAMTNWDQDGAGPLPPLLVVGGDHAQYGDLLAWNPATRRWSPMGADVFGVFALTTMPNGDLIAGGRFNAIGGVSVNKIGRFNGTTWSPLGTGISGGISFVEISALAVLPNGHLVAAGVFTHAGGVAVNHIARWDGATWHAMGTGMGDTINNYPWVLALAVLPNGDLIAGGSFDTAGGVPASNIARWNGTAWSAMGEGVDSSVYSLATTPGGNVVAGGTFTYAGGTHIGYGIARWNGTAWSSVGSGVGGQVLALAVLPNGDVIAGGNLVTAGSVNALRVARWNGTSWSSLDTGTNSTVCALTVLPGGDLVAGGLFSSAGGIPSHRVASWNGTSWSPLRSSMNGVVNALKVLPGGDLAAGGTFTATGGISANRIARWDGTTWSPLGSGMGLGQGVGYGAVYALEVEPDGTLIAGGYFIQAGGVTVENVARWNGTAWSGLGSASGCCGTGVNHNVFALGLLPDTQAAVQPHGYWVMVGGSFWDLLRFARWSGSDWYQNAWTNDAVVAIEPHPDGGLVVGGYFTSTYNGDVSRIGRFNDSGWTTMGSGMNDFVYALTIMPNGDVVAGGGFTTAGGVSANKIARWDGSVWSAMGEGMDGPVIELEVMPNGDLIAGGLFTTAGGVSANNIARWDGSAWAALGTGVNDYVHALAVLPNGDLAVGGNFTIAGGNYSPYFALWHSVGSSPVLADLDGDCDVDGDDLQLFETCASGPAVAFAAGCENRDFDHDDDVDMDDFSSFQRCYSGANKPADPNCMN